MRVKEQTVALDRLQKDVVLDIRTKQDQKYTNIKIEVRKMLATLSDSNLEFLDNIKGGLDALDQKDATYFC
jgi:hypothetical protein